MEARPIFRLSRSKPVDVRPSVIKRYLEKVPGARPYIPIDRHEPVEAFTAIAASVPVFRVVPRVWG